MKIFISDHDFSGFFSLKTSATAKTTGESKSSIPFSNQRGDRTKKRNLLDLTIGHEGL